MSARQVEPQISAVHPRETADLFGHREAETALLERLSQRAHSACLADRRRAGHRQGDAGLSHGALRARPSRSAGGRRCSAPKRCRSIPPIPSRAMIAAGAHGGLLTLERTAQRQGRDADRDHGRRDPRDDLVLRLDRGGGGLAGLHRRYRRRAQSERGQRAAQDARGAAAAIAVPAGQPRAGAGAADHPVALPQTCRCGRSRPTTSSRAAAAGRTASRSTIPRWPRRRRLRRAASRAR